MTDQLREALEELLRIHTGPKLNDEGRSYRAVIKARAALATPAAAAEPITTFAEAWAKMEARGYRYGEDALENVRMGWDLAMGMLANEVVGPDTTPAAAAEPSELDRLRAIIDEVHSWAVCACIASPEDMAQNFPHIVEITLPAATPAAAAEPMSEYDAGQIVKKLNDGIAGSQRGWGWIEVVRAVERHHGIESTSLALRTGDKP